MWGGRMWWFMRSMPRGGPLPARCLRQQSSISGSCAQACGNSPNGICWCDDTCILNGDCCQDACEACGICTTCSPDCAGKECGDDGCGGTCGNCAPGTSCASGVCASPLGPSCKGSCGSSGQDGTCWCDDQCEANGDCCADACDECGLCSGGGCIPDCSGKDCGDNGCGQPCGICNRTETCVVAGTCEPKGRLCSDCSSKECGDNGCGGTCGACPPGEVCDTDSSFWACTAPEEGGGTGETCIPDCGNKNCGGDGCGGSCGGCMPPAQCTATGQCQFPNSTTDEELPSENSDLLKWRNPHPAPVNPRPWWSQHQQMGAQQEGTIGSYSYSCSWWVPGAHVNSGGAPFSGGIAPDVFPALGRKQTLRFPL